MNHVSIFCKPENNSKKGLDLYSFHVRVLLNESQKEITKNHPDMKVTLISLEGSDSPVSVSVNMTTEEAIWIAVMAGQCKGIGPHGGIYHGLTDGFFDRFWEEGVAEAEREFHVSIPRINE